MSNYTQTTFFTPKDSLPITDPNKTIFGAAYDVEFANLSAAIQTKLDATFTNPALISLNITGAATPANGFALPSANTLAIYTNSTQRATINANGQWSFVAPGVTGAGFTINTNPSGNVLDVEALAAFNGKAGITSMNNNGGTAVQAILAVNNGTNASYFAATGTAFSGSPLGTNVGGPTGQMAYIATFTSQPLMFGTNNTYAGFVGGSTQGLVWGNATGGDKGSGTVNAVGLYVNGVAVGATAAPVVGTGTSTLNASSIVVGQTYIVYRNSSNSVSNSVSATLDSVVQLTNIPVGTYNFTAFAAFSAASTTPGVTWGINNSGGTISGSWVAGWLQGFSTATSRLMAGGGLAASQDTLATFSTTSGVSTPMSGQFTVSVGPTAVGLSWAQGTSNATATVLAAGAYVAITRIA